MASVAVPGLSVLTNWPTEHLTEAIPRWRATADQWTAAFTRVWQDSHLIDWQGFGADGLRQRTTADKPVVEGLAGRLDGAVKVARTGASQLVAASARVRYAVEDAWDAGFDVGEDGSVVDRRCYADLAQRAARQAQAEELAGTIRRRAGQLMGLDQQIGGRITELTAGLGGVRFPESPAGDGAVPQGGPRDTGPDFGTGDIDEVDHRNRDLLDQLEREYSRLPGGQVKTDRLADIAAIRQALKVSDSHLIYLARPDDPDQMIPAATAIGDPFNAARVSVTVPGVSSTTRGAIANMTDEAAGLRREAQEIAQKVGDTQNISTISWTGYQPPPVIDSPDTLSDRLAQAGAPKLESFLQNLDAASHNPGHTTALFGHSYGSLVSGIALKDGASSVVDNAVLYGSPGFEATSPAKLGMTDHNFFVMTAPDDYFIRGAGATAPLHGWGADPNDVIHQSGQPDRYRFTHLQTDQGWVNLGGEQIHKTGAHGHSGYPRNPTEQMTGFNLAAVLLDRPDLAVRVNP